jgi:hypothetical protein
MGLGAKNAHRGGRFFEPIFSLQEAARSDKKSMVDSSQEKIPHLIQAAGALRKVRRAKQMFLLQWALESAKADRLDTRMGADLRPRNLKAERNLFND